MHSFICGFLSTRGNEIIPLSLNFWENDRKPSFSFFSFFSHPLSTFVSFVNLDRDLSQLFSSFNSLVGRRVTFKEKKSINPVVIYIRHGGGKECYVTFSLSLFLIGFSFVLSVACFVWGWYSPGLKSAFISIVLWTDMVRCLYLDARIRRSYADNAIIVIPRRRHRFHSVVRNWPKASYVDHVRPPFFLR